MLRNAGGPEARIALENRPENVAVVRQALTGVASAVRMDGGLVDDVKTAVSEACNNVVVHAYAGERGPMEVHAAPQGHELVVTVTDAGAGIQPGPEEPAEMRGVGLSLIQALTKSVQFVGDGARGTSVVMTFESDSQLDLGVEGQSSNGHAPIEPPAADIELSVCGLLTGPVLASVVAMVAARAGFSMERLSDAQIVADTIAAYGPASFAGRHVHVGLDVAEGELSLRLGPLVPEGGSALVTASAVGGLAPLLERLPDEVGLERLDGHERLTLRFRDATLPAG